MSERHHDAGPRISINRDRGREAGADRIAGSVALQPSDRLAEMPAPVALGLGPGVPLPPPERSYFERRLGTDLSPVRLHPEAPAAAALGARAFAAGRDIGFAPGAFRPGTGEFRQLLGHEIGHVIQQGKAGPSVQLQEAPPATATPRTSAPVPADAQPPPGGGYPRVTAAPPALRRDINVSGRVPLGTLAITGHPEPERKGALGNHENAEITFQPNPYPASPATEKINFIQIASWPLSEQGGPDATLSADDRIKDRAYTKAGGIAHLTAAGDTAESVSVAHFGDANHAVAILRANTGQLIWWMARQRSPAGVPPDTGEDAGLAALTGAPLPAGTVLTIPDAVKGGFVVDIDPIDRAAGSGGGGPTLKQPRSAKSDPDVAPEYPHMKREMQPGGFFRASYGFNRAQGGTHAATMTDSPGGGPISGHFTFESSAHAEDLGLSYGAVKWGFYYDFQGISGEWATISPGVSDTLKAGIVSFNRVFKNHHIAQQGDTLNSLAVQYYGRTDQAHMIYLRNRTVLTTDDAATPIPPATAIDVGIGPSAWDVANAGAKR